MRALSLAATLALSLGLAAPSHAASNQEMVNLCLLAMKTDTTTNTETNYRLKSIKGGGTKKVKFETKNGSTSEDVVCKIRGGEVIAIDKPSA